MGRRTSAFGSLAAHLSLLLSALLVLAPPSSCGRPATEWEEPSVLTSTERKADEDDTENGDSTRWALLVAGSSGYDNYRHQADVCHAYQILRRGGLKEENIVVMMYDDIAHNPLNPRPGVIINHPNGSDVYAGVPKDYTGKHVTAKNMYAVILGDKEAVQGGSGKVIDSKPNDRIFIYYADHGGSGILEMPNYPSVIADDFVAVLKKKHESKSYKEMVIYVEACESGSIFQGLLPESLNIYVTTASNAHESSWAAYCPTTVPPSPPEYQTCLGDLYSVAWMEDSDKHNLKLETIGKQYESVKQRTAAGFNSSGSSSHVMEYGYKGIKKEKLNLYQGFDPANAKDTDNGPKLSVPMTVVNQRDADILFLWKRYEQLKESSNSKEDILKEITETIRHRTHLDSSIDIIGKLIFGYSNGPSTLTAVRPPAQALVDDWGCLKSMVRVFESRCGSLTQYGMKHMRAFANICNKGVSKEIMEEACTSTCRSYNLDDQWSPYIHGYSA